MVSKKRTGNFADNNVHPQSAEARARSKEIAAPPAVRETLTFTQRIAMKATLAGIVTLALLVPAYSQQEINPTWYDPWAAPNTAVAQLSRDRLITEKRKSNQPRPRGTKAKDQVSKRLAIASTPGKLPQK